jgi:hypothetical protein
VIEEARMQLLKMPEKQFWRTAGAPPAEPMPIVVPDRLGRATDFLSSLILGLKVWNASSPFLKM